MAKSTPIEYTFKKAHAPKGTIRYEMIRYTDRAKIRPDTDKNKKKIIREWAHVEFWTPVRTLNRIYNYPGFKITFIDDSTVTITEVTSYTQTKS